MEKVLVWTKHFKMYFSTEQVGIGLMFIPFARRIHLNLIVFEIILDFYKYSNKEDENYEL